MKYRYELETIGPLKFNELQKHEILVIVRNCMSLIHLYEPIYMKYMIIWIILTRCHMTIRTIKWIFNANYKLA
jgi:hypothetical protein